MGSPSMTIPDSVFTEIKRLGFDTSPFIYFVERHPAYLPMMRDVVRKIDEGDDKGLCLGDHTYRGACASQT